MSTRAGVVVTGTEVLTGRVTDRNGPWLAERLRELGIDLAHIAIVGDRPEDMRAALDFMAAERLELIVTSGGLGPTADDLTAAVVGAFQDREMVLDEALSARIAKIVAPLMKRWPNIDPEAVAEANRKQATIPSGAEVLEPVGTAPGLVVAPSEGRRDGPTVVVLPGPPRELQPMWDAAVSSAGMQAVLADATVYRQETLRLFGIPESEIAESLRAARRDGVELDAIEVTTCLKRGEVEVVTRYEPDQRQTYEALRGLLRERHGETLFSEDGRTVDEQVADLLRGDGSLPALTIATAESCTGGLMAARLTERPGSSDYVKGGIVAYSDEVKASAAGVPSALIERHGAVSQEVAEALADGARERLDADVGIGITGIAGPGGGSAEKPVGLVWLSVASPDSADRDRGATRVTRSVNLPGGRADVRDRATTVALHLVRRALLGEV